ncbi:hypothetical protein KY285_022068 [Solanum tuberosum]|nr:hypothetical protein KY285_022068 [Solanum tuberosum]
MNGNNWMAAHAQGAGEGAGAAAGDWRTGLVPYTRQRIVNKILEDIQRVFPVFRHRHVQELREIAVMFEEKMYNVATSWNDYLYRISFKLRTMTNYFHINTASSGQNAHGPGMTMEATSYETTSGPEDSDKEAAEEDDEGVHKEDVVEEVVGTKEQNYVVGHKDNVRVVENELPVLMVVVEECVVVDNVLVVVLVVMIEQLTVVVGNDGGCAGREVARVFYSKISCGLSSGAKLDERLAQVEERLEKMEAHSEKMETLLVDINKMLNYLVKM